MFYSIKIIIFQAPKQSRLVSDLNANDMTNYLLSTEKNRDKTTFKRRELTELTRKLGDGTSEHLSP